MVCLAGRTARALSNRMEMFMSHRLWWRVTDILPLAAHAAATPRQNLLPARQELAVYACPALLWSSGPAGDWLSSNGVPIWYAADGGQYRIRADTWFHPATGTSGSPPQRQPADGVLALLTEHLDGRRTLLDLLQFARRNDLHWFGLDPDPAADDTNSRYLVTAGRGDLLPADAVWLPATVTSTMVDGRTYPAMVADGYTARDGVLARFAPHILQRLAEEQNHAAHADDVGAVAQLHRVGDMVLVVRQTYDEDGGLRWIEEDRCNPDADGYYPLGAYQWSWTRT